MIAKIKHIIYQIFVFEKRTFYLYQCKTDSPGNFNEVDFLPKVPSFKLQLVSDPLQLDELVGPDVKLPLSSSQIKKRLKQGARVFVITINNEFALWDWLALTKQAKDTFNRYPYRVDFDNHEACTGGAWTTPKFRGLGLFKYQQFKRQEILRSLGVQKIRSITDVTNLPSQKAHRDSVDEICGKAEYLRVLGIQFWKEKPLG
jgi:hypothetical protein